MIVIIDNKDSFVWNLADYASIYDSVKVVPNTISIGDLKKLNPDGIIISPGPGAPENKRDVENCPEIIKTMDVPVLGVCLGHQTIAHIFGGKVGRIPPVHGKSSSVTHDSKGIFKDIKNPFTAGRYHSLAVLEVPENFTVTATTEDGTVMGIRHNDMPIEGFQFHPESVLTEFEEKEGLKIIENFVKFAKNYKSSKK
ncbi:anthranilate synthase, component II [Methanococcus maripaludis C5]|uniref:anthranilate synthase n=1 Tax=Methanococcus maripaludis (strain C5 / ATCC BAA-1333) TaxID=402880 RepID=A4FXH4_METM5|nr:aminodeoxychorismate/anthranilate synthase component II [Methanococcus maripaludis]ABO34903.1 anthranilate synthase, component II [Methanococcus maripaludis C5]